MIPDVIDRAIVEIRAVQGPSLGTGSLVSDDGLILTAKHVPHGRTLVEALFRDDSHRAYTATFVDEGAGDWALFRVTDPVPAGVKPVPIGTLGNVASRVVWYTVGHARLRAGLRGGFQGIVRRAAPQLELLCEELSGQMYDDARGLSGAPCVVDGEVVGLIIDVLKRNDGAILAGEVSAIPLASIVPKNVALAFSQGPPLPWEDVITGPLQRLPPAERLIAATVAGIANPIQGERLPVQIARRMINQGVLGTANVLSRLTASTEAAQIDLIMELAETLWVNGSAAESLASILDKKAVALLATEYEWSAVHHTKRAFACRQPGRPVWRTVIVAPSVTTEPFADAVVDEAFTKLAHALSARDRDRATVVRRVQQNHVTAFVVSPPRDDVVEALRAAVPGLAIVFLSRAVPQGAQGGGVFSVIPFPTPQDERNAEQLNDDARALLT